MINDSLIVDSSIFKNLSNLNYGNSEIISIGKILKDVCEQWKGYTYNSHLIYLRLFLLTIIFRFLDKKFPIILFKKSKIKKYFPEYKPKNKFMKWFINLYWSSEDTTLFWEIQDFFHRFIIWKMLYTIFTQLVYVEQLSIIQVILKIFGVG